MTSVDIWALGGAMLEEPRGGSAFAQREQPFLIAFEGNWIEPADDDANVAWGREAYRAVSRFSDGAVYLNFPGTDDERPEHIGATYSANLARLREVKAKYDPTNFFRSNINVAPAELTITMPPGVTTAAQTRA
jgi:hypothetical protein